MPKGEAWGERIRKGRLARGLTAEELAKKAKVDRSTIYRIERQKTAPHPTTLRRILEALEKAPKLPDI